MKRIYKLVLVLIFASILILTGCTNNPSTSGLSAKVIDVVDGDTIKVQFADGQKETIRLLLVDTPETKHPDKPVQPFGPEASAFAKDTLLGKNIEVELDVSERDKYGRLLAYIWIDGKMFNEMLLENGLARVAYVYPPNVKYVDQFRIIQSVAQENEIGIWSIENYAKEDGFNENAVSESNLSTSSAAANSQSDSDCVPTIKGNITSDGEKIYHLPDGQYYESTKAEEMFCTEDEAIKAGYRKSQR